MAELGLAAYRFSVAWPRIQPDGTRAGRTPRAWTSTTGSSTSCSAHGIQPLVTLYHWDLPQALEDRGGWTVAGHRRARSPSTPQAVYARLGDRVRTWTTLNEPWCSAFLGLRRRRARARPARTRPRRSPPSHHLLLGHGLAVAGAARRRRRRPLGHHAQPARGLPGRPGDAGRRRRRPARRRHCQPDLPRPAAARRVPGRRARARRPVHAWRFVAGRRRGDHRRADRLARRELLHAARSVAAQPGAPRQPGSPRYRGRRVPARRPAGDRHGLADRAERRCADLLGGSLPTTPACRSTSPRTAPPTPTRRSGRDGARRRHRADRVPRRPPARRPRRPSHDGVDLRGTSSGR